MNKYLASFFLMLCCAAGVNSSAIAQAPANTDPRNAKVTLPDPANPKLPSLIMIGDSTVRNGHDDGQGKGAAGQWGWGNPIAAYFDPAKINIVNRAVGGLSSRTYMSSGHWERTLPLIKAGDVVLIQFGHNDSGPVNDTVRARGTIKGTGEESEAINNLITKQDEVVHTYGWYLRSYVAQIKARGATPVICSPIPRNNWGTDGKVARAADSYGSWAKQVAAQEKVGFIDLNETIAKYYDAMGRDKANLMFPPEERTHTNMAGAEFNARVVVAGLKALRPPLAGGALNALNDAGRAVPAAEDDRPVVDGAKVAGVQPRDPALPNLFLVGDSTVKSGGAGGAIGWGERIATHFDTNKINVVNHAIGGRSSRTFFTEGRWARVLEQMKAGDFVAIQFGHNDGGRIGDPANKNRASVPGTGPETVEDTKADGSKEQVHTFGWYMARYVADARAKGATVILLSPVPHRDVWENARDFASFAQWDQEVAAKGGALFADLTMVVSDAYRKQGAQVVDTYFSDARTHTNEAGAQFNAARVVDAFNGLPGKPLAKYLK
ncbi:UNVERIFIED_ORG: lysophospholipase L1-like esterase [Zoogloea ramigera]|uniref:Rhamnogalacturonan acetylesterase n=1 Tax=Duganella zoogloeoides TaxID=75659 RepID=A0ABZ0Y543_9BURK|nr:rhamnogalacturonan acetylesterase [Duganella zoogloeoides]WQH07168.1 rhamnogalacturonan acetylesterase [Duganella zoogloeoides]